MLNVLVGADKVEIMEDILFRETTTLGIRRIEAAVHRLGRRWVNVLTRWGYLRVKVGVLGGKEVQYAPEFRECAEIAQKTGTPLKEVYDEVRRAYLESNNHDRQS
jgi:uncharacterized protein (DUF111 family)